MVWGLGEDTRCWRGSGVRAHWLFSTPAVAVLSTICYVLYVILSWQLFHAPFLWGPMLGAQSDRGESKVNINGGGIHLRTGQFTVAVGADQAPVWDQRKLPTGTDVEPGLEEWAFV